MKLVMAYINPFKLEEVRDAVRAVGAPGMTATPVEGFGRQAGHTETYRGSEYEVEFTPKIRVEILVADPLAAAVAEAIQTAARSNRIGDGKIAILEVDDVIRIRTGERGADAL